MIKNILFILLPVIFAATVVKSHPLHLTVTNISYYAEKRTLSISIKIFKDDYQTALQQHFNLNVSLDQYITLDSLSRIYISEKFAVKYGKKPVRLKHLKTELTSDSIWLYYEVKLKRTAKSISLVNNLLNELYSDMTNLVIFSNFITETGLKFDSQNLIHDLQLQ